MEIEPSSSRIIEVTSLDWAPEERKAFFFAGRPTKTRHTRPMMGLNPRPCYPHSRVLVEQLLEEVEKAFPVARPPLLYLPHFDADLATRNAATFQQNLYEEPQDEHGRTQTHSLIILYGKGTPIHPAVTRYLVAHEYGHAVAEVLARDWANNHDPRDTFMRHYAELRGLREVPDYYGSMNWHLHPEEVFANDFRILVAKREVEFWPHPGIPRPEEVPALLKWWPARQREALEAPTRKHFWE